MKYYRLVDDVYIAGRWNLDWIRNEAGVPVNVLGCTALPADTRLTARISKMGTQLNFTMTSFAEPIACQNLAVVMEDFATPYLQIVPVEILGVANYFLLNPLRYIDCLDEESSEFDKWTEEHGEPERIGDYKTMGRFFVRQQVIPRDLHIFRMHRWRLGLIVSESMMGAMLRAGAWGSEFIPVTG